MPTDANPERTLAIGYAPPAARAALHAIFALDDTLAAILRTTREPLVGQMRLTWWYEALVALDGAPPPAEPILQALSRDVVPSGVTGSALAGIAAGWEALLVEPLDMAAIEACARGRGAGVFGAAGTVLDDREDRLAVAGEGWAMADLAARLSDAGLAAGARDAARRTLDAAFVRRWPARSRALGALALSARADIAQSAATRGSPKRVARLLWHRLSGY